MQDNNQKLSKEWIIKSQNDLKSAEILFKEEGPTDSICLHCHQTAEKALKGFLVFSEKEFPKVHDLVYLLNLCKDIDKSFKQLENNTSFLNRFYIEARYPSDVFTYSKTECKKAFEMAQKIFRFTINKIT